MDRPITRSLSRLLTQTLSHSIPGSGPSPWRLALHSGLVLGAALLPMGVGAQAQEPDYRSGDNWLCRAENGDLGACDVNLDTTIVHANGRLAHEAFAAARDPAIDCFYVYPTVSLDSTPNSDLNAGPEEYNVIHQQFARFASRCRTFAPMYRQFTLAALRGRASGADREMSYRDVLAAWNYYLENYNNGRGVVLLGHSQGASVLTRLIRNKIENQPIQEQIISAMLLGTSVQVPTGNVVGGTFENMSLCSHASQIQCIIAYATFRGSVPPSARGYFGRNGSLGRAACVNPAKLAKGSNEVHAYLNAAPGSTGIDSWTSDRPALNTPFAKVPGLLSSACVRTDTHHYLELTVHGEPSDPRADDIGGDVMTPGGSPDPAWGLHLIDMNVGMGDLLTLVDQQTVAYLATRQPRD